MRRLVNVPYFRFITYHYLIIHKKYNLYLVLFFLFLIFTLSLNAQPQLFDHELYPFINYDKNELKGDNTSNLSLFYKSLERLAKQGDNQINIVQIGDSHTQADIFSNQLRMALQNYILGGKSARGFVFPYKLAKTNSPSNYTSDYTGVWTFCRNIAPKCDEPLGLSGITVTTKDATASISIRNKGMDSAVNTFNIIKMLYVPNDTNYEFILENMDNISKLSISKYNGCIEWHLSKEVTEFTVSIRYKGVGNQSFSLMGFSLESDAPGITYHSIGVNGADFPAFNRSKLIFEQLEYLHPDLIILSLGTNDAYTSKLDVPYLEKNITLFLNQLKKIHFQVPVICLLPGDDLYKRRYYNPNNTRVGEVIKKIAHKNHYQTFDFFTIMGGPHSIRYWQKYDLAQGDGIHFTHQGYQLLGNLFMEALIGGFEKEYFKE